MCSIFMIQLQVRTFCLRSKHSLAGGCMQFSGITEENINSRQDSSRLQNHQMVLRHFLKKFYKLKILVNRNPISVNENSGVHDCTLMSTLIVYHLLIMIKIFTGHNWNLSAKFIVLKIKLTIRDSMIFWRSPFISQEYLYGRDHLELLKVL